MRDIEDMLWDLQYDMERREKENRKANARVQKSLNEELDFHLKNKNPEYETFTLSELKTIVASRQKDGKAHIEDRALYKKYWDFVYNFGFYGWFEHEDVDKDEDDPNLGDRLKWFTQAIENYLRERNLL